MHLEQHEGRGTYQIFQLRRIKWQKKLYIFWARNSKDATHFPNWVFWKHCCGWAPEKWAHKCNLEDWIVTGVSGDIIVIYLAEVFWYYHLVEEWTWIFLAKHVCCYLMYNIKLPTPANSLFECIRATQHLQLLPYQNSFVFFDSPDLSLRFQPQFYYCMLKLSKEE